MRRAAVGALAALALVGCKGREAKGSGASPYASMVDAAMPRIEQVTGLRFKQRPTVKQTTRAALRPFLEREFSEKEGAELASQQIVLRRFGLIPDTLDLAKFLRQFYEEQIVAYYLPRDKALYVVTDAPILQNGGEEVLAGTVTHELVHALQDQYVNLDSVQRLRGDDDRVLATQAVMEGQAQFVSIRASGSKLLTWDQMRDQIREGTASMPLYNAAPLFVQEFALFPYLSGSDFMRRYYDKRPGSQPYGADGPSSSEQVLHDDRFFTQRDEPTAVTLPAPAGATAGYQNTFGEFFTRIFLFQHTNDQTLAFRAAGGWDGDRYVVLQTPKGEGIAWVTIWDSHVDAVEFGEALDKAVVRRYGYGQDFTARAGGILHKTRLRDVRVWTGEIAGRPAVMYIDVPKDVDTNAIIDPAKVVLK